MLARKSGSRVGAGVPHFGHGPSNFSCRPLAIAHRIDPPESKQHCQPIRTMILAPRPRHCGLFCLRAKRSGYVGLITSGQCGHPRCTTPSRTNSRGATRGFLEPGQRSAPPADWRYVRLSNLTVSPTTDPSATATVIPTSSFSTTVIPLHLSAVSCQTRFSLVACSKTRRRWSCVSPDIAASTLSDQQRTASFEKCAGGSY